MASVQCKRPTNESCQQKYHGSSSLAQKMSEMTSWVKGHNNGQQACKPSCQTQAHSCQTHVVAASKTQTNCYSCQTQAHSCQTHAAATSRTQTNCYSSQTQAHQTGQGLAKPQGAQCANKASGGRHTHTHGQGHSHTKPQATNGVSCHCVNKTNGHHGHKHGHSHGHCHANATNGVSGTCEQKKERNLFRRIKDRLSGNSSCSDSSSSDSESDNECRRKSKVSFVN